MAEPMFSSQISTDEANNLTNSINNNSIIEKPIVTQNGVKILTLHGVMVDSKLYFSIGTQNGTNFVNSSMQKTTPDDLLMEGYLDPADSTLWLGFAGYPSGTKIVSCKDGLASNQADVFQGAKSNSDIEMQVNQQSDGTNNVSFANNKNSNLRLANKFIKKSEKYEKIGMHNESWKMLYCAQQLMKNKDLIN